MIDIAHVYLHEKVDLEIRRASADISPGERSCSACASFARRCKLSGVKGSEILLKLWALLTHLPVEKLLDLFNPCFHLPMTMSDRRSNFIGQNL